MVWWILPGLLMLVAVTVVVVVLWRRIGDVRMISPETVPTERAKRLKQQILTRRFERMMSEVFGPLTQKTRHASGVFSRVGRRFVQDLTVIQKTQTPPEAAPAVEDAEVLKTAQEAFESGELSRAEDLLINLVGRSPRSVEAFELLSEVYVQGRQFDQARETLEFVLKLTPDRVEALLDLVRIDLEADDETRAWKDMKRAIDLRDRDPRVLDQALRLAVKLNKRSFVETYLPIFREVNQDHPDVEVWENWLSQPKDPLHKEG